MALKKHGELYVITKTKDLCSYIYTVTEKSPKKYRFTFVSKMQTYILDTLEYLYRANMVYVHDKSDLRRIEERKKYQKEAYVSIKLLTYIAMIAMEQKCILSKQFEQISKQSDEVMKLIVAWSRSDQNRYKG